MIGIYSVLGFDSSLKELLDNNKSEKTGTYFIKSNLNAFGIIYSKFNKKYSLALDKEDFIFIDGFIFNNEGKQILAIDILDKIKKNPDFLKNVNGEFFVLAKINNQIFFVNDIMGQRQHSYAKNDLNFYAISPSPGISLNLLNEERVLNKKSFITFLLTKKLRHNRDTIWEKSFVFEPGSIFYYINGAIKKEKYWEINYLKTNQKFDSDKFIDIYKKAVNMRILSNNVGITLTGGLDSRSLIGAINSSKLSNINAYTMGALDSEEVLIASEVAKVLNVEYSPFEVTPEKVLDKKSLEYFFDEDIDLIIQGLWNPFTQNIKKSDYLLHGLDLDVTLGGIYLTDDLLKVKTDIEFYEFVKNENLRINNEQIRLLFKRSKLNELDFNIEDYLKQISFDCEGDNYLEKYDRFILKYSMNRVILQRYRGIRKHIETLSPMYDRNVLEYIFSLNLKSRQNYKAFHPFINKLSKKLAKITYQRTNLPAYIPVKYWKSSQKIEGEREELCRKIANESEGKDFVPYKRYYTNVDEWMRFNSNWKKAIKELLQSENSIIRKQWIDGSYVDKLILEHQNHKKSNLGILHTLMSAELYLRIENKKDFNI